MLFLIDNFFNFCDNSTRNTVSSSANLDCIIYFEEDINLFTVPDVTFKHCSSVQLIISDTATAFDLLLLAWNRLCSHSNTLITDFGLLRAGIDGRSSTWISLENRLDTYRTGKLVCCFDYYYFFRWICI